MALPRKLKHGNIFMDGENWIGVAEDFTRPSWARNSKPIAAAA